MQPNPYIVASSILFVIPTTIAASYRHWKIYAVFQYMTIVSSLYHATKYPPLLFLDYPGCYAIVAVLGYERYKIRQFKQAILYSSMCALLFWGGYITNRLTYSNNVIEQSISHVIMHLIVIISASHTSYEMHRIEQLNLRLQP
jgi:hypothetical protein